jgi:osmotically-inducible protein OsmY
MGTTKDIREAVEAELKFDPLVDDADIHVMNMNGDVALNGTVSSYPQYLEATAAAQRVAGVKNVHNHLEVVLSDADYRDDAMLTTLTGHVRTWAEHDAAVGAAWMANGVIEVRDDLTITG